MPYAFKKGEKVKFNQFDHYTTRGLNPWAWLIVDDVIGRFVHLKPAEGDGSIVQATTDELDTPFGYEDVYEISVVSAEKAAQVYSWLKDRGGIVVYQSQDLSRAGSRGFVPATNSEGVEVVPGMKPHWSMKFVGKVTDPNRITIQIETETFDKPKDPKNWKYSKKHRCWYKSEKWEPK